MRMKRHYYMNQKQGVAKSNRVIWRDFTSQRQQLYCSKHAVACRATRFAMTKLGTVQVARILARAVPTHSRTHRRPAALVARATEARPGSLVDAVLVAQAQSVGREVTISGLANM